jgi:hypothetical protein
MIGMPTSRYPCAAAILLLVTLLGWSQMTGCRRSLNRSDQLYGTSTLTALEPDELIESEPTDAEAMAGTSIAPLDRSAETMLVLRIQQAQVEHEPTYLSARPLVASSTRDDDQWPDLKQALSVKTDDGDAALDGLLEPFRPLVSLLISPISMIIDPPLEVMVGPRGQEPLLPDAGYPTPWRWVQPNAELPDDDAP